MDSGQIILGIAPALFTLLGTLVGSALTSQSGRMQERLKQDGVARAALLDVSDAVHRLAWRNKVGALSPDDALIFGTGSIADSLLTSAKDARKALIGAGVPYRAAAMALDPIDRLVVRQGQLKVHETDADDAQALVGYLLGLLDRGRSYRRSRLALARLRGSFDRPTKSRYLRFLASKISEPVPTEEDEQRDPATVDGFYERCGVWLRENTRNTKKFSILFNENVSYGYRRNLFALKWPALALNLAVVLLCIWALAGGGPFADLGALKSRIMVVFVVAAIHAAYIGLAVNQRGVGEAARAYARQLILCCETFLGKDKPAASKRSSAKRRSGTAVT